MIKKLKSSLLIIAALATLTAPALALSTTASAADNTVTPQTTYGNNPDITNNTCNGTTTQLNANAGGCQTINQNAGTSFNNILTNVVNIFSIVVGIVAVIMIIVGGFKYITSGGQSEGVSSAKNTIIYALVGLVIVALAQFIVHFVIGKVAGIGGGSSTLVQALGSLL